MSNSGIESEMQKIMESGMSLSVFRHYPHLQVGPDLSHILADLLRNQIYKSFHPIGAESRIAE